MLGSIFSNKRLDERNAGLDHVSELKKHQKKTFVIHYSCESFIPNHGNTPRITSICVKNRGNGETTSFSIHLQAQFHKKDFNNLSDDDYDFLEREMLNEFYQFVRRYQTHYWVHWHMRNSNYGFVAIANRLRILKGKECQIKDDLKFDLPQILGKVYTFTYEKDIPNGKLLNLCNRNGINTRDALTGEQEANCFNNRQFLQLHMSTLRKVELIDRVLELEEKGELKTGATWKSIYGVSGPGLSEMVKNSWWLLLILSIAGYVLGTTFEPVVQNFFGTS